ncbi:hypothetical protein RHGRI_028291 [Rhododendron griersonianum]|uniref:GH3 middle domain-containing protein n=1 Tax=Rhododendron griersonianum TaxID=479676 RepID=A0AAV6IF95_9ERIC|nr:hypothetical protein RHGRI_028291 [Rhododendron griersonianum]
MQKSIVVQFEYSFLKYSWSRSCALEQSSPRLFFVPSSSSSVIGPTCATTSEPVIWTLQSQTLHVDRPCRPYFCRLTHILQARSRAFAAGRPSWKGIVCHLWPRAKYIEAVVTGSIARYIPSLEYYSDAKLPLVCPMYASSECYFGVNLKPLCDPADVEFTLLPNMGYFEFLPLGDNGDKLVDLVDVWLGCYYELVVTTFASRRAYLSVLMIG